MAVLSPCESKLAVAAYVEVLEHRTGGRLELSGEPLGKVFPASGES